MLSSQEIHRKNPRESSDYPTKGCLRKEGEGPSPRKRVWFDYLEAREYPIILGDNPSVTDGVPVTIGWKPQRVFFGEVEDIEMHRQTRRHGRELVLSDGQRFKL